MPDATKGLNARRWTFKPGWVHIRVMTKLSFPFTAEQIRALKVGDEVLISDVVSVTCFVSGVVLRHCVRLPSRFTLPSST